jgi:micrococcal nuclease
MPSSPAARSRRNIHIRSAVRKQGCGAVRQCSIALVGVLALALILGGRTRDRLVVRVIDGDTIELDHGEHVRLIGVDAPESVDRRKPVQCFSRESAAFLRKLLKQKRVRLMYGDTRRDRFGRTLAYVFLKNGTHVNEMLVKKGYAFAYVRYRFSYQDEFVRFEREARTRRKGLWGAKCIDELPSTARKKGLPRVSERHPEVRR